MNQYFMNRIGDRPRSSMNYLVPLKAFMVPNVILELVQAGVFFVTPIKMTGKDTPTMLLILMPVQVPLIVGLLVLKR